MPFYGYLKNPFIVNAVSLGRNIVGLRWAEGDAIRRDEMWKRRKFHVPARQLLSFL